MGHHNRHFAGDRYALSGAWSPPTSSANFCEEDYVVSIYVAEFINSLTNFAYVYFALRYMYGRGSRGLFAPKSDFMSISLLILGICSFLFHATLRQTLQFADELGMLLLAWSLLQGLLTGRRPGGYDLAINVILAIVFPVFAAFYVWTGKIIYHATAFIIMVVVMAARGHHLFYWRNPAFPTAKLEVWRFQGAKALGLLILGYGLWNVDLELCAQLRSLRESVGLPWAWLFELHGWWHILTAWAANVLIEVIREVQEELTQEKANGHLNGHANGKSDGIANEKANGAH
ncbi:ceramidase [Hypoxylon rubiginosum]|uniref:Ceramidase n=1 Tax=Hypoxylon rubiginosum TaxID=110542 RepID=A0ACC0CMT7_9PEZI|nr:ceramidase [Hypoxylon rubiginosum]